SQNLGGQDSAPDLAKPCHAPLQRCSEWMAGNVRFCADTVIMTGERRGRMEGPRALQENEFESLRALTDAVFRPGMPEQYPQLFNADNRENLRVCVDEGLCVSHVGMTERKASLLGCTIQVCCIGAVSTYKEYRGQGLASRCFDDAVAKAFQDGVDLM